MDETCVMCNDCFISSDHEHHEVFFYYTHSGGCCDCGDTEAWAPEGFCTRHRVCLGCLFFRAGWKGVMVRRLLLMIVCCCVLCVLFL